MQPESDKVCAIVVHLLLVMVTGTSLTLRNLILMVREDLHTTHLVSQGYQGFLYRTEPPTNKVVLQVRLANVMSLCGCDNGM